MFEIYYDKYRSVSGFNSRVRFLIMHYTALDFKRSITELTGTGVSSHYLVPDPTEKTYLESGFNEMAIFNLVNENDRAWHAGVSAWAGRTNLNDSSIGIETVNLATYSQGAFHFPPFHPQQVEAIIALAKSIIQRHPDIAPTNVLAHSDISVGRKSDPGPMFPWEQLYEAGVGAWPDCEKVKSYIEKFARAGLPEQLRLLQLFKSYGYDTSGACNLFGYQQLTRAFQLHFRPSHYDGQMDVETAAILAALCEKYKNIVTT